MKFLLDRATLIFAAYVALLVVLVMNVTVLLGVITTFLRVLIPLFIGIGIAFILKGPQRFFNRKLFHRLKKPKLQKTLSVVSAYLSLVLVITIVMAVLIPQLVSSVEQLIDNMSTYQKNLEKIFNQVVSFVGLEQFSFDQLSKLASNLPEEATTFAKGILPQVFDFTTGLVGNLTNSLLGLILSIYILFDLKRIKAQTKRLACHLMGKEKTEASIYYVNIINKSFSDFIKGQSIEVLILGVLCFVGMMIFGFSYPLLISLIIAITSFVPIVGPIIGLVPAAFLLLMVNPMEAVYFLLFIVVLQQIEGNLIYPRVVGEQVGLPPMFVLLAIIIGGGLFGILGMLIGVPTMSAIFTITNNKMKEREEA